MNRQQICEKLITIVRCRIAEFLTCANNDLPELSLGRLINLIAQAIKALKGER